MSANSRSKIYSKLNLVMLQVFTSGSLGVSGSPCRELFRHSFNEKIEHISTELHELHTDERFMPFGP